MKKKSEYWRKNELLERIYRDIKVYEK